MGGVRVSPASWGVMDHANGLPSFVPEGDLFLVQPKSRTQPLVHRSVGDPGRVAGIP